MVIWLRQKAGWAGIKSLIYFDYLVAQMGSSRFCLKFLLYFFLLLEIGKLSLCLDKPSSRETRIMTPGEILLSFFIFILDSSFNKIIIITIITNKTKILDVAYWLYDVKVSYWFCQNQCHIWVEVQPEKTVTFPMTRWIIKLITLILINIQRRRDLEINLLILMVCLFGHFVTYRICYCSRAQRTNADSFATIHLQVKMKSPQHLQVFCSELI